MSTHHPSKTTAPGLDIEQLIYDIAEQPSDEAFEQLYKTLIHRELFLLGDNASGTSTLTQTQSDETSTNNNGIQIKSVAGPKGEPFASLMTAEDSPLVSTTCVSIRWLTALALVLKTEAVVGVLLQGKNSWIGFYKPQIENILAIYGSGEEQEQS